MEENSALSLKNPVFKLFLGHATLVLLKMVLMSFVVALLRTSRKTFTSEEDCVAFGDRTTKVKRDDPVVERVRRAHLNDLENIIPFILLGLLYVTSGPSLWAATQFCRVFTICRFMHTFVYVFSVPQPARALMFFGGLLINISLAVLVLMQGAF